MLKIKSISINILEIPLKFPFITSLRQTNCIRDLVVIIKTNDKLIGYGSCAIVPVITNENENSLITTIKEILAPKLIGKEINNINLLLYDMHTAVDKNNSAKMALEIALLDLFAQSFNLPLYKYLGGGMNVIETGITINAKDISTMLSDAKFYTNKGYKTIKLKVGFNKDHDLEAINVLYKKIAHDASIILDANQGWSLQDSIEILKTIKKNKIKVMFVEQPIEKSQLASLKRLSKQTMVPIIADESMFDVKDCFKIIKDNICAGVNIKLAKCGGIINANNIYHLATSMGLKVMAGCMLESPISLAAVSSFIAGKNLFIYNDLDPIELIKKNPILGGIKLKANKIYLSSQNGLGIKTIKDGLNFIDEVK